MLAPGVPRLGDSSLGAVVGSGGVNAQDVGQSEVGTRIPPFVVKTRLTRSDQATTTLDEAANTGALTVGQGAKIGKDQQAEFIARLVDLIDMDQKIRDASPKQGVGQAALGQSHAFLDNVAAIEIDVFLAPDDSDRRDRPTVHEIFLIHRVPLPKWLGGAILTPILVVGTDVVPPGLEAAGHAFNHPEPRLRLRLAG